MIGGCSRSGRVLEARKESREQATSQRRTTVRAKSNTHDSTRSILAGGASVDTATTVLEPLGRSRVLAWPDRTPAAWKAKAQGIGDSFVQRHPDSFMDNAVFHRERPSQIGPVTSAHQRWGARAAVLVTPPVCICGACDVWWLIALGSRHEGGAGVSRKLRLIHRQCEQTVASAHEEHRGGRAMYWDHSGDDN